MYCYLSYQIPFSETDAMGIVHHANHPRYFERGRVEFLRLIDLSYLDLTKRGVHFPVTGLSVQYKRPLAFDDIILVETKMSKLTKTRFTFEYRLVKVPTLKPAFLAEQPVDEKTLVTGTSEHCCVGNDGRPTEMASDLFARISKYAMVSSA